jgi:hypothetical protein
MHLTGFHHRVWAVILLSCAQLFAGVTASISGTVKDPKLCPSFRQLGRTETADARMGHQRSHQFLNRPSDNPGGNG